MSRFLIIQIFVFSLFVSAVSVKDIKAVQNVENPDTLIKLLILSGSNNHKWQETSPFLEKIFTESSRFSVDVTIRPDTLNYNDFSLYDVVVSNWNSWPENDIRWPKAAEDGLLKYVESGGGLVFFHASTSAFYEWPEFKNISTGAWRDGLTKHGEQGIVHVEIDNANHPITKGLDGFIVFDELWENAEINQDFKVLGTAWSEQCKDKQAAIMVAEIEKGRVFHTIQGHHVRALRNSGVTSVLLRGTEWAATGEVSISLPQEFHSAVNEPSGFSWVENDTALALMENDWILWQFNFNTKYGKPYFHPIFVNRNRLTCLSPDDHPWHLGEWFSWKYINDINYWEYLGKSYLSEGITDIKSVKIKKRSDFSADITLRIEYHPPNEETVLTETRIIRISTPQKDGSILMDYDMSFKAVADSVDLNRTPILGEPDGKSWGGYAGLSVRFNQDLMDQKFISSFGEDKEINGRTGDWLYMGFQGLDGNRVGSTIMISEDTRREGEAWYSVVTPELPFYYFSPAYLYLKSRLLTKGERINLKYKILHLAGDVASEELIMKYNNHIDSTNQ